MCCSWRYRVRGIGVVVHRASRSGRQRCLRSAGHRSRLPPARSRGRARPGAEHDRRGSTQGRCTASCDQSTYRAGEHCRSGRSQLVRRIRTNGGRGAPLDQHAGATDRRVARRRFDHGTGDDQRRPVRRAKEPSCRRFLRLYSVRGHPGPHGSSQAGSHVRACGAAAPALVLFAEGGGGRGSDPDRGFSTMETDTFYKFARLSGLAPLVGIASGRCFAGNAVAAGLLRRHHRDRRHHDGDGADRP